MSNRDYVSQACSIVGVLGIVLICVLLIYGIAGAQAYYIDTIYTPCGVGLECFVEEDTISHAWAMMDSLYWKALFGNNIVWMGPATNTYSCHAYAWGESCNCHVFSQTLYKYLSSYIESPWGDILTYGASVSRELPYPVHSAVVVSAVDQWCKSKWGWNGALWGHNESAVPYVYNSPAAYYQRIDCPGPTTGIHAIPLNYHDEHVKEYMYGVGRGRLKEENEERRKSSRSLIVVGEERDENAVRQYVELMREIGRDASCMIVEKVTGEMLLRVRDINGGGDSLAILWKKSQKIERNDVHKKKDICNALVIGCPSQIIHLPSTEDILARFCGLISQDRDSAMCR